jgi:hypothetical protein
VVDGSADRAAVSVEAGTEEVAVNVRITQLDGALPNLALMKLSHWHKAQGHEVVFSRSVERDLFEPAEYDWVYGSAIFNFSQIRLMRFQRNFPGAVIGGTGTPSRVTVEELIEDEYEHYDYSLYPDVTFSIGFTMRGCRNKCGFCVVPKKEGAPRSVNTIADIYRGEPWPRHLHLLDNDFFGNPEWPARIEEMRAGKFKVAMTQGINVRNLTDEQAAAIASLDYREGRDFKAKRIYTAWDNPKDETKLMRGLEALAKHGVKPDHIMVYMLIGYWPRETEEHWLHRRNQLRAFGARPYPMPFKRTKETVGFQRWVVGSYDKRIPWDAWKAAGYEPRNLGEQSATVEMEACE